MRRPCLPDKERSGTKAFPLLNEVSQDNKNGFIGCGMPMSGNRRAHSIGVSIGVGSIHYTKWVQFSAHWWHKNPDGWTDAD